MNAESTLHKFIIESFQYSVTGRLGHGIVHNLNGPLQILSMQLEMLKMGLMQQESKIHELAKGETALAEFREFLESGRDRVEQAATVVNRLEAMIHVIGYRGEDEKGESQKRPVEMSSFLKDFIEFWYADLYFKHRVEKSIDIPAGAVFSVIEEAVVLAMLDGIMAALLYCIKAGGEASFSLSMSPCPEGGCRIEFGHGGMDIPEDICESVAALRDIYIADPDAALLNCGNMAGQPPHLFVALLLAAVRSVDAGWDIEISPRTVVVSAEGQ